MTTDAQSVPRSKIALAKGLEWTPWSRIVRGIERARPFLRLFNYHGTPQRLWGNLSRQLDYLLSRYRGARADELEPLLEHGVEGRSAVLFTFDDGLANNCEVAAELLEARGLTGIFCVPSDFPSVPRDLQPRWFVEHVRPVRNSEHQQDEDLLGMTWSQVRALAERGHRICCHSQSHLTIRADTPGEMVTREVVGSKQVLEAQLPGVAIDGFCWPVDFDQMAADADALVRANYRYALCGGTQPLFAGHDRFRLYRTNLEAGWSLEVVALQLSGVIDAKFAAQRLRGRLAAAIGRSP